MSGYSLRFRWAIQDLEVGLGFTKFASGSERVNTNKTKASLLVNQLMYKCKGKRLVGKKINRKRNFPNLVSLTLLLPSYLCPQNILEKFEKEASSVITQTVPLEWTHPEFSFEWSHL